MKKGVLLLNLGTPSSLTKAGVRAFLKEFLLDPRVVDLPAPLRYLLVYGIILPFRTAKSLEAYEQIWTESGSPIMIHAERLREKLSLAEPETVFAIAMRYGEPSIRGAIDHLMSAGCDHIVVFPLFPQYASASTGSAVALALQEMSRLNNQPSVRVIGDYYDHPDYIQALASVTRDQLASFSPDFVLFSYHGIPVRQAAATGCKPCQGDTPCPVIDSGCRFCYRAQCYATTRALVAELGLSDGQYTTAFQSRLGKTPWIEPYTDLLLPKLYEQGARRLAIVSPSFTADCLETLEELGIRAREDWEALGGDGFLRVDCLNDSDAWVSAIHRMLHP